MDRKGLRRLLGLFFIALVIPSAVLGWQAYSRLQWEAFHQYQVMAAELLGRIDRRVRTLIAREQARAFEAYDFLAEGPGVPGAYQKRSALSGFPVSGDIPGLIGHFQLDADGHFSTPLLPSGPGVSALDFGIAETELAQRRALGEKLLGILSQEGPAAAVQPGAARERDAVSLTVDGRADESLQQAGAVRPASGDTPGPTDTAAVADSRRPPSSRKSIEAPAAEPGGVDSGPAREEREQQRAQAAFDRLSDYASAMRKSRKQQASAGNIGLVEELRLERAFDRDRVSDDKRRAPTVSGERVVTGVAGDRMATARAPMASGRGAAVDEGERTSAIEAPALVRMFESEVDPLQFGPVGSAHFVLYRKVWRDGRRYIQGAVIDRRVWLRELIETPYRETALVGMSRLGIAFDDEVLSALGGQQGRSYLSSTEELSGTLLHRGRFSNPLGRLELIFSVTRLPTGAAGGLITWVAFLLVLILSGGLMLMYRLGVRQIELSRQQRDFVSAVSHELKTPLTSIRMYSEMLREGWADEERRRSYYDFIHDESERLSRLISNVLQLARMGRGELNVDPQAVSVRQLMDMIESKLASQVAHAGFDLRFATGDETAGRMLAVDHDAFTQIMINLVDNAIKFSARADRRLIEIVARDHGAGRVEFAVRDHGPGIRRDQMKKIFRLFYRAEDELTRETVGTGIGLALVHRLARAMGGEVDVVNREPGAEFRVRFATLDPGGRT